MVLLGIATGVGHKGENVHLKLRREVLGEWSGFQSCFIGINKLLPFTGLMCVL